LTTSANILVAGVDEAGRGPLAGPVVVAAVILSESQKLPGLDDSKRLTAGRREALFSMICEVAVAWSVVEVPADEIDRVNILQATLQGMQKAVENLMPQPQRVLIDGNRAPKISGDVRTIIQGDRLVPVISAASILAKVSRDRCMCRWHRKFPQYGFDQNMGYATPGHLRQLERFGPCDIHRRSFAPVRRLLQQKLF